MRTEARQWRILRGRDRISGFMQRFGKIPFVFILLMWPLALPAQPMADPALSRRGAQVVQVQGRDQLEVDGVPFFVHGCAFPYYSLPADVWERSLEEYRSLGINTIDLRIPWNWHQVGPSEYDFAGKTNPRRNLRRLLRLIAEKELKLIVRPAARIPGWRNSGEPADDPGVDAAARTAALARFVESLAQELKPYISTAALVIPDRESRKGNAEKTISGPLLLVALPMPGAREILRRAGMDVGFFAGADAADAPRLAEWPALASPALRPTPGLPPRSRVLGAEVAAIEQTAAALAAQRGLPGMAGNLPLGIPPAADDVRPVETPLDDSLLRSRLLFGQGLGGIIYEGIQDALAPVGFAAPGTNSFARIDVALDVNANRQAGVRSVVRNGNLLDVWGPFLASSQKRADLAVIPAPDGKDAALHWRQISQAARAAGLALTAADPLHQDAEALLANPLIIWNTQMTGPLPEAAQAALADYARRGGTLVIFPERPAGPGFSAVWARGNNPPGVFPAESGKILVVPEDPFAEDKWEQGVGEPSNVAAVEMMHQWLSAAGRRPVVGRNAPVEPALVISQLVNTSGARPLGGRARENAAGLLSVTNLSGETIGDQLEIISPRVPALAKEGTLLHLPLTVPAHESLLLPLHAALCSDAKKRPCEDEIVVAGAEFLWAEREGKQLNLTFYAPVRAVARFRFEQQPARVRSDEISMEGVWTTATREFEIAIPRGPAPDYLRVVRIQLPYEPRVPEKIDPEKVGRRDYDFAVADGMRFPLAADAALETYPPLVGVKGDHTGRMLMRGHNYDGMGRDIDFRLTGPIKSDHELALDRGELGFRRMDLKPADNGNAPRGPGLIEGHLEARSGRDKRTLPIAFVAVEEKGVAAYTFDFDRDGAPEWVLEDEHLRIIAAPARGGRLVALMDKDAGLSLTTTLGFLGDSLTDNTADARSPVDLAHAPYTAQWISEGENKLLQLQSPQEQAVKITKTIAITEKQTFEVKYRWEGPALFARTLATAFSIPAVWHGESTTRFCWEKPAEPGAAQPLPGSAPNMRCEVFDPAGSAFTVPAGIGHLEIRAPGSYVMRVEWPAGEMQVEMKNYSAWLHFAFPRPAAGAAAGESVLKFHTVVVE